MTETPKTRKEIAEIGAASKKIASKHMSLVEFVANKLQLLVEAYTYVDISKGAALALGVSDTTLNVAIRRLEEQGLAKRHYIHPQQKKTENLVALRVLAFPETIWNEIYEHRGDIYKIPTVGETRQEQLNRREERQRTKIAKSSTYGLTLDQKLEKINRADIPETQKRSLRAIAKSEARAEKGKWAWALKAKGYSNVAIGKHMGVSESTVRVLLKPYAEQSQAIKTLMDAGQQALEETRETILEYVTSMPEFQEVFGEGFGDAYVLRIHTFERTVQINPNKKRVEFTLKFWAQNEK